MKYMKYLRYNKRRLGALCLAVCLAAIAAAGTSAYFTASDTAHNVITSGAIDIVLVEKTLDADGKTLVDFPANGLSGVMPGEAVSKIVTVQSLEEDAWIRVKVEKSITKDGVALPSDVMTCNFNTAKWIAGADGYYYYTEPVAMNTSTAVLFDTVTFAPEMDNAYAGCRAEISIIAQAVQSKNNPIPDGGDVTAIPGWPDPSGNAGTF